jgi:ADP-ribosylglycohydrolase
MRLAPVPLFFHARPVDAVGYSGLSSRTTHGAPGAVDACRYLGALIIGALQGRSKEELLRRRFEPAPGVWEAEPLCPEVVAVADGTFKQREPPEIRAESAAVKSLEAALWAFHRSGSFEEGCLLAVNLGDDSDTVGAVYGQLAGAYHGVGRIPVAWIEGLSKVEVVEGFAKALFEASQQN